LLPNPSAATDLERRAWDCSPESSRQLAGALRANTLNVEDVKALGRPVMLAEAIIFDRFHGTIQAAAVIEGLGVWQRNGAGVESATRSAV